MVSESDESSAKQRNDQCWVFIDNSNLLINGQKHVAEKRRLHVKQDLRMRIDVGNLAKHLIGNRQSSQPLARLYGSEPPTVDDSAWLEIEKKYIEVQIFKKNAQGKEKGLDAKLSFDLAVIAMENRNAGNSGTFVIVSGDRDYLDCLKDLMQWHFKVELVSWKRCLAAEYVAIEEKERNFKIRYLDDEIELANDICYYDNLWKKDINCYPSGVPNDRAMVIEFAESCPEAIVDAATKLFHTPCYYCWENGPRKLLVIAQHPETNEHFDFAQLYNSHKEELRRCAEQHCGIVTSMSLANERNGDEKRNDTSETSDDVFNADFTRDQLQLQSRSRTTPERADGVDKDLTAALQPAVSSVSSPPTVAVATNCVDSFWCTKGNSCCGKHNRAEERFFLNMPDPEMRRAYKTRQCDSGIRGYSCIFRYDPTQCVFAHGKKDARCRICKTRGKHFENGCPSRFM